MYTFENRILNYHEMWYCNNMKYYNLKIDNKIPYRTVPEMVTTILREAILSGELRGGEPLKQDNLSSQFKISMSPLREALKNLEAEGLVKFYPNRGAIVSELSQEEAQEIFDIRLFLELGALELSIPNLTEHDFLSAKKIIDQADQETCGNHWGELNQEFHETLYLPAGNPKLMSLIKNLHNNVERYMRLYLLKMNYQKRSQEEHRSLLAACENRDVAKAQEILRSHMKDASIMVGNYLSKIDGKEL